MAKYVLFEDCGTDVWTSEYNEKREAVAAAEKAWDRLSEYDRKYRTVIYVLESDNPDENAENHFDGTAVFTIFT